MADLVTDTQRQPRRDILMRRYGLTTLDWTALVITIIGGINWGLVGIFDWNLVAAIFGSMSVVSRIIYALVGISSVYLAVISPRLCRTDARGVTTTRSETP